MKVKTLCLLFPLIIIIVSSTDCSMEYEYDPDWIIGKTSAQIIEKYGEFDRAQGSPSQSDGLYRNCVCSYIIVPPRPAILDIGNPEVYFSIRFNEQGAADGCYEERGGLGG